MQHTNLDIVKNIAIQLIYTNPEPIEDSGFCKCLQKILGKGKTLMLLLV